MAKQYIVNEDMLKALLILGFELGMIAPDEGLKLALTLRAPGPLFDGTQELVEATVEVITPNTAAPEEFSVSLDGETSTVTCEGDDDMNIVSWVRNYMAVMQIKHQ